MTVHFIGAGPGAADLITLRAQRLIAASPVVLYAGALVPDEVLAHAPDGARLIDTRTSTSTRSSPSTRPPGSAARTSRACTRATSRSGARPPSRCAASTRSAIAYDITPGVPAFAAAAASLGRELTLPGVAQTVILTRHARRATPMPAGEELGALAAHGATLVLHLAVQAIDELAPLLAEHYGVDGAVAVVARASQPDELVLRGTLATIAEQVRAAGVRRTAVIIVGPALDEPGFCDSHLYSAARERAGESAGST